MEDPRDAEAKPETKTTVYERLNNIEKVLALELGLPRSQIRAHLIQATLSSTIDETDNVMEWLSAYSAMLEYYDCP